KSEACWRSPVTRTSVIVTNPRSGSLTIDSRFSAVSVLMRWATFGARAVSATASSCVRVGRNPEVIPDLPNPIEWPRSHRPHGRVVGLYARPRGGPAGSYGSPDVARERARATEV